MKRRLDLAMTLVGNPRIIFLDEPTTGLDPRSRHNMWQIIRELVSDGATVFLTTQYLEEADEVADRIAVLNDGKIAAEQAEELKRLIPGGHVQLRFADPAAYRAGHRRAARDRPRLPGANPADPQRRHPTASCAPSSTGWTPPMCTPTSSPCTPPTSTTCSSPLPAAPASRTSPRRPSDELPLPRRTRLVHDARRNLLHARRYPSLTLNLLLTPIMLLLLFVYVFGDTMTRASAAAVRTAPSTSRISSRASC